MTIHIEAPRLLLEKMAWLNTVIEKNRVKNIGSRDALKEYDELLKVMRYAYQYMAETEYLFAKNERLGMVVKYLTEENTRMERELAKYSILRELKSAGTLEDELQKINHYEEKLLDINKTSD